MFSDIRYALRRLVKSPGFSLLTLMVMTAGLGMACFIYVLVKQLAYADTGLPHHERLAQIDAVVEGFERNGGQISLHDFRYFAEQQKSFELFMPAQAEAVTVSGGQFPERVIGYAVRAELFEMAGTRPQLGRVLQASDLQAGAEPVAVISHLLWRNYFAGDENILGRSVRLNGKPVTVVGVMPEGFHVPDITDIWMPFNELVEAKPGKNFVSIYARLRPGVSFEQATAELSAMAKSLEQQFPETNKSTGVKVWPITQIGMANSMLVVVMIAGAGVAILLLVWVNAGNLLLARASEQHKETAIRAALGAPRWVLLRQTLTEALLLSLAGAVLGCFFAGWALELSAPMLEATSSSGRMPFWWQMKLDPGATVFTLTLALITAVLTAALPAWKATSGQVASVLRDGTRGATSRHTGRVARALVVAEIALSAALLIAAGVMVAAVDRAVNMDYGARVDGYTVGSVELLVERYQDRQKRQLFITQLQQQLQANPQLQDHAIGSSLPGGWAPGINVRPEHLDVPDKRYPGADLIEISDNFFSHFDIRLLSGRAFSAADTAESLPVAIVSEVFAKTHWPNGTPIGKRVLMYAGTEKETWVTVVGVAAQVIFGQPVGAAPGRPGIYVPLRQSNPDSFGVSLRGEGDVQALGNALRAAVTALDNELSVIRVSSLRERVQRSTSGMRFVSKIFMALALIGVLLAASGIYGVTARGVVQRTQELGVRRAIGASDAGILAMLAKSGARHLLVGLGIGVTLGVFAGQILSKLFHDVGAIVGVMAVLITLLIAIIVMTATLLPARRAIRLTPMDALRYE